MPAPEPNYAQRAQNCELELVQMKLYVETLLNQLSVLAERLRQNQVGDVGRSTDINALRREITAIKADRDNYAVQLQRVNRQLKETEDILRYFQDLVNRVKDVLNG